MLEKINERGVAQVADLDCGFQQIYNPPFSSNMASCDYYLFVKLKKDLVDDI